MVRSDGQETRGGSLGKKPNNKKNDMSSTPKIKTPPEVRNFGERRVGDPCPSSPASTSCAGSGAAAMARPSPKPAIVENRRVSINVERLDMGNYKVGLRPDTSRETASAQEDGGTEVIGTTPVARPKRTRGNKGSKEDKDINADKSVSLEKTPPSEHDVEFVSVLNVGNISRPTTPADPDLEITRYETSRSRRCSSASSSGTGVNKQKAGQKRRRIISSPEDADDEGTDGGPSIGVLSELQKGLTEERARALERLSSCEIAALATEWLEQAEDARAKSKNIQGALTRKIKVNLHSTAQAVRTLAIRASAKGDPEYWKSRVQGLHEELAEAKLQIQRLTDRLAAGEIGMTERPVETHMELGTPPLEPPLPLREERIPGPSREKSSKNRDRGLSEEPIGRMVKASPPGPRYQPRLEKEFLSDLAATIKGAIAESFAAMVPARGIHRGPPVGVLPTTANPRPRLGVGNGIATGAAAVRRAETEDEDPRVLFSPPRKKKQLRTCTRTRPAPLHLPPTDGGETTERGVKGEDVETRALPGSRMMSSQVENDRGAPPSARKTKGTALPNRRPRSSAVTLICPEGNMSYAEALKKAKEKIILGDLGTEDTRMRCTVSGGILIELPGQDTSLAADALAAKLKDSFKDSDVRVGRPMLKDELRLSGLDASMSAEEVLAEVTRIGGCAVDNIRLGNARIARNSFRTTWLQCPLEAALKIADAGTLRVGWSTARAELLKKRPLQCYKCLGIGHVRWKCLSEHDRSVHCFNCGGEDHIARECRRPASCPVCRERGLPHNHRAGSEVCPSYSPRRTPPRSQRADDAADRSVVAGPSKNG
ncbi:PREDICTED: uncharacterized protein LOC105447788 [Wasmannia auropunctata]|uniref:uncharacterized protein LOC105447788 n=1 Tax=Wasmannia auropunctata TaxID=64793 RepID=UPI0005EEB01F|nr:PREDICTED: uncharacterized protein LOC105447788 [Wasmannia auropunctata]